MGTITVYPTLTLLQFTLPIGTITVYLRLFNQQNLPIFFRFFADFLPKKFAGRVNCNSAGLHTKQNSTLVTPPNCFPARVFYSLCVPKK